MLGIILVLVGPNHTPAPVVNVYGQQARRRLSVVSDNRLIEGFSHPSGDQRSGDIFSSAPGEGGGGRGCAGVDIGKDPGMAAARVSGIPTRGGGGLGEGSRSEGSCSVGDKEYKEEYGAIPCIVSRYISRFWLCAPFAAS